MSHFEKSGPAICLVTPVFNDWEALAQLLAAIEKSLGPLVSKLAVVAVNDTSTIVCDPQSLIPNPHSLIQSITMLDLRANVGHQFAIAAGLHYAHEHQVSDAFLIMDADGEDRPDDAAKLITAWQANPRHLIVAERAKRSESLVFKMFYLFYRRIFRALTGHSISFGNFSLIPAALLPSLLSRPELIYHFAATMLRTRLPITRVATARGNRYAGISRMNMPALVLHAVGALSVFSDVLFSRILISTAFVGVFCAAGMITATSMRLFTPYAFPNWATTVVGLTCH